MDDKVITTSRILRQLDMAERALETWEDPHAGNRAACRAGYMSTVNICGQGSDGKCVECGMDWSLRT